MHKHAQFEEVELLHVQASLVSDMFLDFMLVCWLCDARGSALGGSFWFTLVIVCSKAFLIQEFGLDMSSCM